MRIPPNKFFYILGFLCPTVFAAPGPPPPGVPPPPGLPIDNGLEVLLVVAILFGLYKTYQLKLNKKTPI